MRTFLLTAIGLFSILTSTGCNLLSVPTVPESVTVVSGLSSEDIPDSVGDVTRRLGPGAPCIQNNMCQEGLICSRFVCSGNGILEVGAICDETEECVPNSICWNESCIGVGALRFSLSWTVDTDFDLHINTPSGAHIYYANRIQEGGELDVDDCISGGCRNPEGTHVENIVFAENAAPGTYQYWVNNYDGSMEGEFEIQVYNGGDLLETQTGTISSTVLDSEQFEITP